MPGDDSNETIAFHCRSPIYMCPTCSHALKCSDLLNILRIFSFEDKGDRFDYLRNFPFFKERDFSVDPRNKTNDLSAGEWLTFTRTAFTSKFPQILGHKLRSRHPEYKSPILMGQFIAFFANREEMVLDPFAGTGASLIAASLLGRDAVGFEIFPEWVDIYHSVCKKEKIQKLKMMIGDCRELLKYVPPESVDFVIMDPPGFLNTHEWAGSDSGTLGEYFSFIGDVIKGCSFTLRRKKYLALFARNVYHKGTYYFLVPGLIKAAENAGLVLKGEKIWENPGERLKPYGYPHSYVPNIVHYNILIFQKA